MFTLLAGVYVAVGAVYFAQASHRLRRSRTPGDTLFEVSDHVALGAVALLASAVWPVLLSIYLAGWLLSHRGRAHRDQLHSRIDGWRRAHLPAWLLQRT